MTKQKMSWLKVKASLTPVRQGEEQTLALQEELRRQRDELRRIEGKLEAAKEGLRNAEWLIERANNLDDQYIARKHDWYAKNRSITKVSKTTS